MVSPEVEGFPGGAGTYVGGGGESDTDGGAVRWDRWSEGCSLGEGTILIVGAGDTLGFRLLLPRWPVLDAENLVFLYFAKGERPRLQCYQLRLPRT